MGHPLGFTQVGGRCLGLEVGLELACRNSIWDGGSVNTPCSYLCSHIGYRAVSRNCKHTVLAWSNCGLTLEQQHESFRKVTSLMCFFVDAGRRKVAKAEFQTFNNPGSDMAVVWNPCTAKSQGEQRLARLLESFQDDDLRLCFSIDFIPGVREIDLLLMDLKLGLFVIEIKAVSITGIESVSPNHWKIKGRDGSESPLRQAYGQFEGLRSYWVGRMKSRLPRVCITACLPEISRHEWRRAFGHNTYANSIANTLIFREDLIDATTLQSILREAMKNPPIRSGFEPAPLRQDFLDDFQTLLEPTKPQVATDVDRHRLAALERGVNKELTGEFPAGGSAFTVFTGHPGTGKTFRLLSIGLSHAYSDQRVLFACFNKTLASDVKRLLSFNEKLDHTAYAIDVVDVNQLAIRAFEMNGLPFEKTTTADQWGEMVVNHLRENREKAIIELYDTILVDEAHDMVDWQLELLKLHATAGATICIALGKGQELYRDDSSALAWLKTMSNGKNVTEKDLRRNFRNTQGQYFAALAFHRAWPDRLTEVDKVHAEVFKRRSSNLQLEFDRQGEPLTYLPIPALPGEFEYDGQDQEELVTEEYLRIIETEMKAIDETSASPVGLLILVPNERSKQANCVREALKRATSKRDGVSFIDYTVDTKRRTTALSSEVRLCTFHSSRGLEGERVIIFGLEEIASFAENTSVKAENLGFIALSRGVFRTVVVVRSHYMNATHALLKKIMISYAKTGEGASFSLN